MRGFGVAVFLLLLVLGCRAGSPNPKTFLKGWESIADEYLATGKQLNAAPLPDLRGLSGAERSQVIGDEVIRAAGLYEALVPRARALQPPSGYEDLKDVLVDTVEGTARYTKEWGEAIKTQVKTNADAASKRLDQHCLSSVDRLIKCMADHGIDVSRYKAQRRQMAEMLGG